jgi:hypothetical protein
MPRKFTNGIDLTNQLAINVADPQAGTDAANKQYVDAIARGLSWKASVAAASTANVNLASAPATLDGVALAANDRVLLKNQSDLAENGVYVFAAETDPLTRAADMDAAADFTGAAVTVVSGSTLGDTVWIQTEIVTTVDTDDVAFTQLGGGGSVYVAGAGLTESPAGTFNVGAGSGITVNADDVALASSAAGAGLTYTTGVLAVGAGDGISVAADAVAVASTIAGNGLTFTTGVVAVGAGTGITVSADAIAVDTTVVARKASGSIGNGVATTIQFTHNLNTLDVTVGVFENSSGEEVDCDVVHNGVNTVTLTFAVAPTTNQFRAVVVG